MIKKSKQIIKFTQNFCGVKVEDNSTLFVRVESAVTDKNAVIEVPITHCAMMIKNGDNCRMIKSGEKVFENRQEVKNWKHGHSVDVVYMPKDPSVIISWGTFEPVSYRDKGSGIMLQVRANGSFSITLEDHEKFFRKIVGMNKKFDLEDFSRRVRAMVLEEFTDVFMSVVDSEGMKYETFALNKKRIATAIGRVLGERIKNKIGVGIDEFIIEQIQVEGAEKIEKELQEKKDIAKFGDAEYRAYLENKERQADKAWQRSQELNKIAREEFAADREYDLKAREIDSRVAIAGAMFGGNVSSCGSKELSGDELYKKVINNNFEVSVRGLNNKSWCGSGFIVDMKNHLAITNAHVAADSDTFKPATNVKAIFGDFVTDAKVVALADDKAGHGSGVDLAVLQLADLPSSASCAELCGVNNVNNGETVYVVGNARGEGVCITKGIVSDKQHNVRGTNDSLIMIDAAANPGNSGGPVYNAQGQVIGVLVSGYSDAKGMNFAIQSDYVRGLLKALN